MSTMNENLCPAQNVMCTCGKDCKCGEGCKCGVVPEKASSQPLSQPTSQPQPTALLDSATHAHVPVSAVDVVKQRFALFTAGKLSTVQELRSIFTDDCVFDVTADMVNTDMFREHRGIDELAAWTKFFTETFMVENFTAVCSPGPCDGSVYVISKWGPVTNKKTGKELLETCQTMQTWTVVNGKIKHGKVFFSNSAGRLDALLADGNSSKRAR